MKKTGSMLYPVKKNELQKKFCFISIAWVQFSYKTKKFRF